MKKLDELENVIEYEARTQSKLPKPTYLYIGHYGRRADEYAEQFMAFAAKSDCIRYTVRDQSEKSMEASLDCEVNRHKPLGKEYEGVIIINLGGIEAETSRLERFVSYIKEQYGYNYIVFEVRDDYEINLLLGIIGNYFFIRRIEAPKYTREEMQAIIEGVMSDYDASLSKANMKLLLDWVTSRAWEKDEDVETKIISITKNILYEMGVRHQGKRISKENVQEILDRECVRKNSGITIGF